MKSPFTDLQINPDLVCQFFGTFARFEYAMKATDYCGKDRYGNAQPDWNELTQQLADKLMPTLNDSERELIGYLLANPPQVQKCVEKQAVFKEEALRGDSDGAKAIEGAKRVRNNLFHGGKHTQHSEPGRDARLIEAAMTVLGACLSIHPGLNTEFEQQQA